MASLFISKTETKQPEGPCALQLYYFVKDGSKVDELFRSMERLSTDYVRAQKTEDFDAHRDYSTAAECVGLRLLNAVSSETKIIAPVPGEEVQCKIYSGWARDIEKPETSFFKAEFHFFLEGADWSHAVLVVRREEPK